MSSGGKLSDGRPRRTTANYGDEFDFLSYMVETDLHFISTNEPYKWEDDDLGRETFTAPFFIPKKLNLLCARLQTS